MNPVLSSLKPILEDSKFVTTDEDAIRKIAPELAKEELPIPEWKAPVFIEEDSNRTKNYFSLGNTIFIEEDHKKTIDYFFLGNTINFAFLDFSSKKRFEVDYKGNWRGAFGMWACLKRALDNNVPILNAAYLKEMDVDTVKWLFSGNSPMPMIEERKEIFNEVGEILYEKYNGHFYDLVDKSNCKAFGGDGIVDRLTRDFPSFNDVSEFNGSELKFFKRAQLAVAMTYGRLKNRDRTIYETDGFKVNDIDDLTVFADYEVPKGLKRIGVLEYAESLDERIRKQEIIEKNSREELEIRAHTIYASDLLIKEINKYRDKKINALNMDYKLWGEARNSKEPHHLTPTIFY